MTNPVPRIVFFSSKSENTLRFINRLNLPSIRLPLSKNEPLPPVTDDYILIVPTFGAGKTMGAVPMPVRRFLNEDELGRAHCRGVIGNGNTTYGKFATSADLISKKLQVPVLHKFEVLGMPEDVTLVRRIVFERFPDQAVLESAPAGLFAHPTQFI